MKRTVFMALLAAAFFLVAAAAVLIWLLTDLEKTAGWPALIPVLLLAGCFYSLHRAFLAWVSKRG